MSLTQRPEEISTLADRLRTYKSEIIRIWSDQIAQEAPPELRTNLPTLIDSVPIMLERLAETLETRSSESVDKVAEVSREHARDRIKVTGYSIEKVLHEYRILRQVLFKTLENDAPINSKDRDIINLAIDDAIVDAGAEFFRIQMSLEQLARVEAELTARRLEDLQMITEIALTHGNDLDTLLNDILDMISKIFGTDTVAIFLFSNDRKSLLLRATSGMENPSEEETQIPLGHGISGGIIADNRARIVNDVSTVDTASPLLIRSKIKSLMGAPLRLERKPIGVIHTGTLKRRPFSSDDLYLLQLMADRIAIAIDHARLYDQINQDMERLKLERALRERFVATLSHDLRNPLATAKMGASLSLRYLQKPEILGKHIKKTLDGIERADRMIEDLLDANWIQAGQPLPIRIEHSELKSLVSSWIDDLSSTYGARFKLVTDLDKIYGYWSPRDIRRAFDNLASNAVKFSDPETPITIKLASVGEDVLISVNNKGSLLTDEQRARIFEPFHQVQGSSKHQKKGWGLGLTLVKGIAQAHKGNIVVKSDSENGTTFTLVLPKNAKNQNEKQTA